MKTPYIRSRLRRVAALALLALTASTLIAITQPASSASALTIDCSYSPGLKAWVDTGVIPGVSCGGRDASGTSPKSGGSGSTGGTGSGPTATGCPPTTSNLPDNFLANVSLHDSTSWSWATYPLEGWGVGTRKNYINNRLHSEMSLYQYWQGSTERYMLTYNLWSGGKAYVATYNSTQPCGTGFSLQVQSNSPAPSGTGVPREQPLVGPGLPMTPPAGKLQTRGSLTAIPGSPGDYFLRIDLTNPSTEALSTAAFVEMGFGDAYTLKSVAAVPGDAECDVVARAIEQCTLPRIVPGETSTLTFVATAQTSALGSLPVTVSNIGSIRGIVEYKPDLFRTLGLVVGLTNLYSVAPPVDLSAPDCGSDGSSPSTGSALPDTAPENVIAGTATRLQSLCSNSGRLPMTATALHGTASMDEHGWVTYTPDASYCGIDTISVITTDPATGASSPASTFDVLVVAPANAEDDTYTVSESTPFVSSSGVLANDRVPETDGWMVQQGTTPPAHGVLAVDTHDGTFVYTPATGYTGTDTFKYRLSGPDGTSSNVATVTLTIRAG